MVVIHIKKSDADQFLYVTTCSASCDTVIRELVRCLLVRSAHDREPFCAQLHTSSRALLTNTFHSCLRGAAGGRCGAVCVCACSAAAHLEPD